LLEWRASWRWQWYVLRFCQEKAMLKGKRALVTGGARRLGRAIAIELARAGADVAVHYHQSAAEAADTVAELRAAGVIAGAAQGDLADPQACERVVDEAAALLGGLDLLVNSAGIWGPTPVGAATAERWDALVDTNVRSAFLLAQRAAPLLRASRGAIVNITDVGVERPWRSHAAYLASKGALVALTRALALDLAPEVRVNAVAPGTVLLPDGWTAEQSERAARRTLLRRLGRPEDVGQAVVFLAGADYVTGAVLPVDGGGSLAPAAGGA
jgi:pteridine reductase